MGKVSKMMPHDGGGYHAAVYQPSFILRPRFPRCFITLLPQRHVHKLNERAAGRAVLARIAASIRQRDNPVIQRQLRRCTAKAAAAATAGPYAGTALISRGSAQSDIVSCRGCAKVERPVCSERCEVHRVACRRVGDAAVAALLRRNITRHGRGPREVVVAGRLLVNKFRLAQTLATHEVNGRVARKAVLTATVAVAEFERNAAVLQARGAGQAQTGGREAVVRAGDLTDTRSRRTAACFWLGYKRATDIDDVCIFACRRGEEGLG